MFEKTMTDFIRGLRTNKYTPSYIQKSQSEIQVEILNQQTRKNALKKLLILYLLGIDISWAAFHIIQSMSIREEKQAGYLIATLAFNQNSPILIMATNVVKKDLSSNDVGEVLLALHTLAQITSHDLGRDLHFDVCNLLNHSNTSVRKRSILVLFRMIKKYPGCWDSCFPRLQAKLSDLDNSVVSCCVTVICELGREEPQKYLQLAPQLFALMVSTSNNWMLIKMVKLFASLCPHEPRLVKKLLEPIRKLIEQSTAISVVYECVMTLIRGDMLSISSRETDELSQLCFKKLEYFLSHNDQNSITFNSSISWIVCFVKISYQDAKSSCNASSNCIEMY